jgi:hypothetical protein
MSDDTEHPTHHPPRGALHKNAPKQHRSRAPKAVRCMHGLADHGKLKWYIFVILVFTGNIACYFILENIQNTCPYMKKLIKGNNLNSVEMSIERV